MTVIPRPPRTLRTQFLLLISALLMFTIAIVLATTIWNARRGVLEQLQLDGKVIGSLIENAVVLARALPDDLEQIIGEEMHATATAVAHYVALANKAGLAPAEVNRTLRRIVNEATIDEIWVTDEKGTSELNTAGTRFQFTPDAARQPQAAEFWPLLSREAKSLVQKTQPRDLDKRLFKYVGTVGVDRPRIVQVGNSAEYMNRVRELVGLERLLQSLVAEGYVRQIIVVNRDLQPVAQAATDWRPLPPLSAAQQAGLRRVMTQAHSELRVADDAIELYVNIKGEDDQDDAFLARFRRSALDQRLSTQTQWGLAAGAIAFLVGALLSVTFARRLTRPLEAATRAAADVEAGRFDDDAELARLATRDDELGRLVRVFRSMAGEVKNREQILDGLVRERTRELAQKNADLEAARATIDDELELARRLQFSIVPAQFPRIPNCRGAARMLPATHMGGDFYDFIPLPDGRIALVMADVAGKGVAAAFLMAVTRTRLQALAHEYEDPAACLQVANTLLCANNPLNLFITLFYGVLDPRTGALRYANGGHNPPLLRRPNGEIRTLNEATGVALGILPDLTYTSITATLQAGDLLLMFTDGVTEAFDLEQRLYGERRLQELIAADAGDDPALLVDTLCADVARHAAGAPQSDDITIAALHWLPED